MFLVRLLKGKVRLWQAWWLFWWLPLLIFDVFSWFLPNIFTTLSIITISFLLLIYAFIRILGPFAIWRCSSNTESRGWTSVARILIVLSPIINVVRIMGLNPDIQPTFFLQLAVLSSVCIIVIYLIGRLIKSQKIMSLLNQYFAPYFLLAGGIFLFLGELSLISSAIDNQLR